MKIVRCVQITGSEDTILSVELKDILRCLNDPEGIKWNLLWLFGTGDLGEGKSIVDFENRINESENGLMCSWAEIKEFSNELFQGIDIVLIGDSETQNLKRYKNDEEMYLNCSYSIELIDSSYWIIHTNDEAFLNNLINSLEGIKLL